MKGINEIKKAKVYSDLFSDNEAKAKKEYREYCKLYHPDANDSKEAAEVFEIITEIYNNKHRNTISSATVQEEFTFKDRKTGKGFTISNPVIIKTGISIIYHTATKIVITYHKSYEKFFNNYIKQVEDLKYKDDNMRKEFKRYFPRVLKHFETKDDMLCILLDKTNEVLSLSKIVKSYEKIGEKFPERQAAWILNRLFNITCYMYFSNKVSNGLSLDNLWVSPEMHSVLLLGGWEYTTKDKESMLGCPKDIYNLLPIKIKDSKKSDILTDLESIKHIGRILFKGHDKLEHINKYLKSGVKHDNPFDEWNEYKTAIKEQFGKREFVVWENVPYN